MAEINRTWIPPTAEELAPEVRAEHWGPKQPTPLKVHSQWSGVLQKVPLDIGSELLSIPKTSKGQLEWELPATTAPDHCLPEKVKLAYTKALEKAQSKEGFNQAVFDIGFFKDGIILARKTQRPYHKTPGKYV